MSEPKRIHSEQGEHEPEARYYDAVGRPRKLASGAMTAIMREFSKGIGTRELAERYGVSVSLILTIVYHTPKGKPHVPERQPDKRQVIYPAFPAHVTDEDDDDEVTDS